MYDQFHTFGLKKIIKHLRNINRVLASQAQSPCGDSRDPVTPASLQTTSVISRRPHRPGGNRLVCSSLLRQFDPTGFSSTPPSLDLFLLFRSHLLLTLPPNLRP
ncbi:hypothetical protein ACN38_g12146 [Penicillium nordicum]|uniref:Uncharacterized protein n=1 Tax=Penicillium nordicum TaxID=229535 RepID=A0A0M8NZ20_9EURO|nr:hypothetical protein ACN38_g12146 [Penicillium nordicum]